MHSAAGNFGYHVWWFPGSPVKVHLSFDVVAGVTRELQRHPNAITQGFLLGRAADGITEILSFRPAVVNADDPSAPSTYAEAESVVGYYRADSGDKFRLSDADLSLAETLLPKLYQVFLLIHPTAFGPPSASFFFHNGSGRISPVSIMEFPFDATSLAAEECDQQEGPARATGRRSAVESPMSLPQGQYRRFRTNAILAGCLLVVFGIGVAAAARTLGRWWPRVRKSPTQAAVQSLSALSVGLGAKHQNDDVEITWNRESPVIAAAISGVLSVEDGNLKRDVALSATDLHNRSIIYVPVSSRVLVHLAITTPFMSVIESVIVIFPHGQAAASEISPPRPLKPAVP
jgi:hypothetical protein